MEPGLYLDLKGALATLGWPTPAVVSSLSQISDRQIHLDFRQAYPGALKKNCQWNFWWGSSCEGLKIRQKTSWNPIIYQVFALAPSKKVVFSPEFERTINSMSSHLIVTMNFTLRLPHWIATTWLLIGNPQPAKAIPSWKPQVHNVSQLQLPDHLDHSWCCCQHVPLSSQNHQSQLLESFFGQLLHFRKIWKEHHRYAVLSKVNFKKSAI